MSIGGYSPYTAGSPAYGGYQTQASPYAGYQQQASPYSGSSYGGYQQPQASPYAGATGTSYGVPAYSGYQTQATPFMGSLGGMNPQGSYLGQLLNMNQGRVDPNFGLIPAASSSFLGTTLALGGAQSLPMSIGRGTSASSLPPLLTGLPVFDVKHFIDGQFQSPMLANPLSSQQMGGFNPLVPFFSPQGQGNYFNQGFPRAFGFPGMMG